jgi:hypothetical protein
VRLFTEVGDILVARVEPVLTTHGPVFAHQVMANLELSRQVRVEVLGQVDLAETAGWRRPGKPERGSAAAVLSILAVTTQPFRQRGILRWLRSSRTPWTWPR